MFKDPNAADLFLGSNFRQFIAILNKNLEGIDHGVVRFINIQLFLFDYHSL